MSHSWRDTAFSDRLAGDLREIADVRLDVRGTKSSVPIETHIAEALESVDGVVLVWTLNTASSDGVRVELEVAGELGIPVFPCLPRAQGGAALELPVGLQPDSGIDYQNEALGFARLCVALLDRLYASRIELPSGAAEAADLGTIINHVRILADGDGGLSQRVLGALEAVKQREEEVQLQIEQGMMLVQRAQEATASALPERRELQAILVAATAQEREYPGLMRHVRQMVEQSLAAIPDSDIVELELPKLLSEPLSDQQLRMELMVLVGPDNLDETLQQVARYLRAAPETLRALHRMAQVHSSPVVASVVQSAVDYFVEVDDLLPDHYGVIGRLDDSWLVHNLAYRIVEAKLARAEDLAGGWQSALRADGLVRELLSGDVFEGLESLLLEWMNELAAVADGYRPALATDATGHRDPVIAEVAQPMSGAIHEPVIESTQLQKSEPPLSRSEDDANDWDAPEVSMFLGMFGLAVSIYYGLPGQAQVVRLSVAVGILLLSIPIISVGARGIVLLVRLLSDPATLPRVWRDARSERVVQRDAQGHRWAKSLPWVAAISVGIGVFIFWIGPNTQFEIDKEREKVAIARSEVVSTDASDAFDDSIDIGLLRALEAYRIAPTVASRDALVTGLQASSHFIKRLVPPGEGAMELAVSPDWRSLAVGRDDGSIEVWDIEAGTQMATFGGTGGSVTALVFSGPDLVISGDAVGFVRLWDPKTSSQQGSPIQLHAGGIRTLSISVDGSTLVSSGGDGNVTVRRIVDGDIGPFVKSVRVSSVFSTAVTADGQLVAVGGLNEIKLFSVAGDDEIRDLESRGGRIDSLAFNTDGTRFVSGDESGTVGWWIVGPGIEERTAATSHRASIKSVVFAAESDFAASADDDDVLKMYVSGRQPLELPPVPIGRGITDIFLSPDGQTLIAAGSAGVDLFGIQISERLSASHPSPGASNPWTVDFGPGDGLLASGGTGGGSNIWSINQDEEEVAVVAELDAGDAVVRSIEYSGAGKLGAGSASGQVLFWEDPFANSLPATVGSHQAEIRAVAFLGDSDSLVSGDMDGKVVVSDTGRVIGQHAGPVFSVASHPNGKLVASGGDNGAVNVWTTNGDNARPVHDLQVDDELVWAVAYSPDGQIVASGGEGGQIVLSWPEEDRRTMIDVETEPGTVFTLEFSSDGRVLAAGVDTTLRLFDVASERSIGPGLTGHSQSVRDVAFSSDGTRLATASPDGTLRIWEVDPLRWTDHACEVAGRNLSLDEWQDFRPLPYVRLCESHPLPSDVSEEVATAQYGVPSDLGVTRKLFAADRSIVIVLIIGVAVAGIYVARQTRRG